MKKMKHSDSRNYHSSDYWPKITSFSEVDFEAIEEGSLVVFDVDDTLIQPTDCFSQYFDEGHTYVLFEKLERHYPLDHVARHSKILREKIILRSPRPFIEPDIAQKIERLKERKVHVIACSAMPPGDHGTVGKLEEWRYNHLKSIGFVGSFEEEIINFPDLFNSPVFYRGVFLVGGESKGRALMALIDHLKLTYKSIIMFDDGYYNLPSACLRSEQRNMQFSGYVYAGKKPKKAWDEVLTFYQVKHLLDHDVWLCDEEAIEKMKQEGINHIPPPQPTKPIENSNLF